MWLAELYRDQGRYADAEPLFKDALEKLEKSLGCSHPYVADVLENYAILLRKTSREGEAEEKKKRAAAIRKEVQLRKTN